MATYDQNTLNELIKELIQISFLIKKANQKQAYIEVFRDFNVKVQYDHCTYIKDKLNFRQSFLEINHHITIQNQLSHKPKTDLLSCAPIKIVSVQISKLENKF